jgi:hypothetical protein
MTAFTRIPQNTNYLQPTKFILSFDRIGSVQYFCQSINVPGISLGQGVYNTPLADIPIAGNKLTYNPLEIDFTINEDVESWNQIQLWMKSIASPKSIQERNSLTALQTNYKNSKLTSYSDATLIVLSALNNPILSVRFINTFPTSLGDIQFDTKQSADDILTATASFAYEYFEFEKA